MIPMVYSKAWHPLPAVVRWVPNCEHWSQQTKVPVALLLAVIHQESGGHENASRFEANYLSKYAQGCADVATKCHMSVQDVATSFGLMQLMFKVAYGYGARSIHDLLNPDNNIRYGAAHIGQMLIKLGVIDRAPGIGEIQTVAARYNGSKPGESYSRNVASLYDKYDRWRRCE